MNCSEIAITEGCSPGDDDPLLGPDGMNSRSGGQN
jgi:hypothetical protein